MSAQPKEQYSNNNNAQLATDNISLNIRTPQLGQAKSLI